MFDVSLSLPKGIRCNDLVDIIRAISNHCISDSIQVTTALPIG